jgi:anti-sigma B factor antagonist
MKLISSTQGNDVLIVKIEDDSLDASNVRDFRTEIQILIQGKSHVVFDMTNLKFVDSSGLGALISCLRDANSRKGEFCLANMSKTVLALFELMRMHRVFSIHETVEGAVATFK